MNIRRHQQPLFVVGSNLNLAQRQWQPQETTINTDIRHREHGNSISQTATTVLVAPRTPHQSLYRIKSLEPTLALGLSPQQSVLRDSERRPSPGKRVSLVDDRESADDEVDVTVRRGLDAQAGGSGPSQSTKKKKPRHISQLNSSEHCSMITSTTSTDEHQLLSSSSLSVNRNLDPSNKRRRSSTSVGVAARNKASHLFRKVFRQKQRSILQIPRLNLPRWIHLPNQMSTPIHPQ